MKNPSSDKKGLSSKERVLKKIVSDRDDSEWFLSQSQYKDKIEISQHAPMAFTESVMLTVSIERPYTMLELILTEGTSKRDLDIAIHLDKKQAIAFAGKLNELIERMAE
jgi:hypothetical protein